jgi:hypothetical protein
MRRGCGAKGDAGVVDLVADVAQVIAKLSTETQQNYPTLEPPRPPGTHAA